MAGPSNRLKEVEIHAFILEDISISDFEFSDNIEVGLGVVLPSVENLSTSDESYMEIDNLGRRR